MKNHVYTLDAIPVNFPEKEIFLRLGGHLTKSTALAEKHRIVASQAYEACHLCGRWCVLEAHAENDGIRLADGTLLPGREFAAKCGNIKALWCAAASAGKEVVELRDSMESVADSAICDAVGSECADAAIDFLQNQAKGELRRRGLLLAERRYSPGYGDMPLELQRFFYDLLDLGTMGLELTGNGFLIPEKSVTAFAGIR